MGSRIAHFLIRKYLFREILSADTSTHIWGPLGAPKLQIPGGERDQANRLGGIAQSGGSRPLKSIYQGGGAFRGT